MDATDYWPFSREYFIWITAVAALQFWMADMDPPMLSNTIEWVYTTFFCSDSAQHLWYISKEILFSHFVATLNVAFNWELTLEDGGYKSGSEILSILTPVCRAPCLYHVSTCDNFCFGPATPRAWSPHQPGNLITVHCCLTFEDDDDSSLDNHTLLARTEHYSPIEQPMIHYLSSIDKEEEDEHFPIAPLNDDIWMEEPVPDRHLCIHEDSQQDLCLYPCPYGLDQLHLTLDYTPQYIDLSNIFEFQDVITTTSDEDIPNLEDVLQL